MNAHYEGEGCNQGNDVISPMNQFWPKLMTFEKYSDQFLILKRRFVVTKTSCYDILLSLINFYRTKKLPDSELQHITCYGVKYEPTISN